MDLVNLLFLAGACQKSMSYLRGKTYEEAWALAETRGEWRMWAIDCGSGSVFAFGDGYGSGSGHAFGSCSGSGHAFGDVYGYGGGTGDVYGCGGGTGDVYGCGDSFGADIEIWYDGAWRGRAWARSEIARLAGEMVKHGRS